MPSNTLSISQLIEFLRKQQVAHGDLDCVMQIAGTKDLVALDGSNINAATAVGDRLLPKPALLFGVWFDARVAQITNMPGQVYQVTQDGVTEWNSDRSAAPDKTELIVWKRFPGPDGSSQDRGYRDGDQWFVYKGGDQPVEIVPDGVLQWRLP